MGVGTIRGVDELGTSCQTLYRDPLPSEATPPPPPLGALSPTLSFCLRGDVNQYQLQAAQEEDEMEVTVGRGAFYGEVVGKGQSSSRPIFPKS